jgi:hypothetical protein
MHSPEPRLRRPCETAGRVLSRQLRTDAQLLGSLLEACSQACRSCGDECERHGREMNMEHCRACADACRCCEQACQELRSSIGA